MIAVIFMLSHNKTWDILICDIKSSQTGKWNSSCIVLGILSLWNSPHWPHKECFLRHFQNAQKCWLFTYQLRLKIPNTWHEQGGTNTRSFHRVAPSKRANVGHEGLQITRFLKPLVSQWGDLCGATRYRACDDTKCKAGHIVFESANIIPSNKFHWYSEYWTTHVQ